jgi:sec-independent protein translocase protein TatA
MNLGPGEIAAILVLALILFGAKRLPELARSLGEGIREFKRSLSDVGADPAPRGPETTPTPKEPEVKR